MAMQYLDMTGKTEEEAVSRALAQLGLDRDEVSVEILERAKSGFFGIGASPAKVRVTYGLEEEEPVQVQPKAAPKPVEKRAEAPKPVKAEAKPAERRRSRRSRRRNPYRPLPRLTSPSGKRRRAPPRISPSARSRRARRSWSCLCRSLRIWESPAAPTTRRPLRSAPSWRASSSIWNLPPR